ncbi:hypothetical protein KP509_01G111300 [Ceratopteris richardii]|uniref:Uncharacterized protein n=1 Tax=Ceratopteris richardii TaxID=49495 RepID=A0A8T2VT17_CERRI|nr:hypothetical protein KP509_01G111300 [Ceratopteris richardii]
MRVNDLMVIISISCPLTSIQNRKMLFSFEFTSQPTPFCSTE